MQRTFVLTRRVALAASEVGTGKSETFEVDQRDPDAGELATAQVTLNAAYPGDTIVLMTTAQWNAKWTADEASRKNATRAAELQAEAAAIGLTLVPATMDAAAIQAANAAV